MITSTLATIGILYLILESNIFHRIRQKIPQKLLCATCLSFWIGLILTFNIVQAFAIMGIMVLIQKIWHITSKNSFF